MGKNWWELTPEDFPIGEPVLKQKRGLWYRKNNRGYTEHLADAGLYGRDEAIRDCFNGNNNGKCDVLAIPVRVAVRLYTSADIEEKIKNLQALLPYVKKSDESGYVVF